MMINRKYLACAALSALLLNSAAVYGQTPEQSFDSIVALIEILNEKGIINQEEADRFIARYRNQGQPAPQEAKLYQSEEEKKQLVDTITSEVAQRVSPYVEGRVAKDINEKFKEKETAEASHWAKRIRFGGDMRLRYQGDYFEEQNANFLDPSELPDQVVYPQTERQRGRVRVRVAAEAQVNDQVKAVVRLSTGNEEDPVSTNDTLGDYMNKDSVVFDQAYVQWQPNKEITAWGGRIPNPWFATDLVWDSDLNFEGLAASYAHEFNDKLSAFLTLGAFGIDEFAETTEDKYLYGAQAGIDTRFMEGYRFKLAVAYYDYDNLVGKADTAQGAPLTGYTAPQYLQKGNTLFYLDPQNTVLGLASDFQELNVTGTFDVEFFDPVHIMLTGDFVKNIGYDEDEVAERIFGHDTYRLGDVEEDEGYLVGLSVGYPKITERWQWLASLKYKYLEADAVLDAFTDSDFHLGGTNAEGWILGGSLGLAKNVWLDLRWLSSDEIEGPQFSVDTLQIDLNVKY
ncbi:MAG: hypothetical protein C4531_06235 [Desulfurivibrio sp.]|nr:MAG: hypothetical protein C4531_06235 [Desulfurivibrio sp.]